MTDRSSKECSHRETNPIADTHASWCVECGAFHDGTQWIHPRNAVETECAHCREVYEIWAGSEGFVPETAPGGYQRRLIEQMRDAAKGGLAVKTSALPVVVPDSVLAQAEALLGQ